MANYHDKNGTLRTVEVDPMAIHRVKKRFSINLNRLEGFNLADNLPMTLEIIKLCTDPDADDNEFCEAHDDASVIESAIEALIQAIVDFQPQRVRELMAV